MTNSKIVAIILAAGLSTRMGEPKLVLPWGKTTVIGQVVDSLHAGGLQNVFVITGGAETLIRQVLHDQRVDFIYNQLYENGEMRDSIIVALKHFLADERYDYALFALGDQPQIKSEVVRGILEATRKTGCPLIIPSFQNRRGHPWVIAKSLWTELVKLPEGKTMRDFLDDHAQMIHYYVVSTNSIISDLDTPEEYLSQKPK